MNIDHEALVRDAADFLRNEGQDDLADAVIALREPSTTSKTVIYLLTDHPLCEGSYQRDDGKWLTLERTVWGAPVGSKE